MKRPEETTTTNINSLEFNKNVISNYIDNNLMDIPSNQLKQLVIEPALVEWLSDWGWKIELRYNQHESIYILTPNV